MPTYRLLQDLLEASDATSPSFTTIVERIATDAPRAELQAAFVAWMPGAARAHPGGATQILRAYHALRDRGLLPSDLVPYSAALQVREAPNRLVALSPELREAVELLEEASRTVTPRGGVDRQRAGLPDQGASVLGPRLHPHRLPDPRLRLADHYVFDRVIGLSFLHRYNYTVRSAEGRILVEDIRS